MTAAVPLSIIGLVLSFVMGALGLFPWASGGDGSSGSTGDTADTYSTETAEAAGNRFFGMYSQVIDDLLSYQKNPDYQRVEGEQEDMATYADALVPMFQEFTGQMSQEMDDLIAEGAALEESSSGGTSG